MNPVADLIQLENCGIVWNRTHAVMVVVSHADFSAIELVFKRPFENISKYLRDYLYWMCVCALKPQLKINICFYMIKCFVKKIIASKSDTVTILDGLGDYDYPLCKF